MDFSYPWDFSSRRSATHASNGMVATSHPVAAQAGLSVLRDGGNAADAAVATAAVLNVVEPHMTGIGGDAFALTHFDGDYHALNASGPAPQSADIETYRERTNETENGEPVMPPDGGLPVTVPGALAGWKALAEKHGSRDLSTLLEPAIDYARDGVPVSEYVARQFETVAPRIREFEETAETFFDDGDPYEAGDVLELPEFADTLEQIRSEGIEAFYGGPIGEDVVAEVQEHGGELALADLEAYEPEWTDPISTEYGDYEVLEHPPNGQGVVALEALNLASEFDVSPTPTNPDRIHHLVEATKLAFADGYEHVTDPEQEIPLEAMLAPEYAAERATEIGHRAREYDAKAGEHADTVYLSVVDGDGNAVSFINSIYMGFGSGLSTRGFALQNRGHSFSLDPAHANCLEPGKRPFHTIIPAMLREDGDFRASWGVMGGSMQPQGHLQVVANLCAGMNPQAALDAPRYRWLEDKQVALETSRIPESVVVNLEGRGHRIVAEDEFFEEGGHWGGGQIVWKTDDGVLIGGSDPRKDGQAVGY